MKRPRLESASHCNVGLAGAYIDGPTRGDSAVGMPDASGPACEAAWTNIDSLHPRGSAAAGLRNGFERSYVGTPAAARDFVRLARRPGPIGAAGGSIARRLLLTGSAGAGKKTLAHAVAAELGLPLAHIPSSTARNAASLARTLQRLDAQARAAGRPQVAYFELTCGALCAPDADAALADYEHWLQVWSAGAHPHLYIVIGVRNARRLEGAIADAVVLQCHLPTPDAAVRHELWQRALACANGGGTVTSTLDAETFDKVVVRPSEGLNGGDIARAIQLAIRHAVTQSPDASAVALTANHLRAAIAHCHQRHAHAVATRIGILDLG